MTNVIYILKCDNVTLPGLNCRTYPFAVVDIPSLSSSNCKSLRLKARDLNWL